MTRPASAQSGPWTSVNRIEDEAVELRCALGRVRSADGLEHIAVEVVRRDELVLEHGELVPVVGRPEVSIDGIHLSRAAARRLTRLLIQADLTVAVYAQDLSKR